MNRIAFLLAILSCGVANAQTPTTITRFINLPTTTSGPLLTDTTVKLAIDGTSLGTRGVTLTNLGSAMLSTQQLVNSLTIKGSGGTISGTNGNLTLTLSGGGVTSVTLGTGLTGVSGTGAITLSNSGVTSITAGNGITVNVNTGAITISNLGVTSFTLGAGLSGVSGTGAITLSNSGVLTVTLGTGLAGVSGAGAITLSNSGVTSFTLGTGLSGVSGAGAITLSNNGLLSLSTPTNSIYNAQLLTGTATLIVNTNAVVQFSNIGVGASPSTAANLYVNTSKSGQIGMRIQGVTSQSSVYLDITTTAGVSVFNVDPFYGVNIRHASTTNMISVGTVGNQVWGLNSSVAASYQQMMLGNGCAFSNTNSILGTTPCLSCTTAGILQITDTAGSRLNLAVGSLSMGYRSVAASGSLTKIGRAHV